MLGDPVAAVDIGTNSVLLLVARPVGTPAAARLEALHEQCTITRLGQGIDRCVTLAPQAVERSLAAVAQAARVIERHGVPVGRRGAIGTAVLRRARNASAFTAPAETLLGCPIEIIGGQREAELVRAGVEGAFGQQPPGTLIFDVGGGSTELIVVAEASTAAAGGVPGAQLASVELGAVRLTERLLRSDPPTADELDAVRAEVRAALARLPAAFDNAASHLVHGVAGTVTTLATVELGLTDYDTERVNGAVLQRDQVARLIERFVAVDLQRRRLIVGLEPARADVITAGALIVEVILERFRARQLRVCDRGVRWGLARELVGGRRPWSGVRT